MLFLYLVINFAYAATLIKPITTVDTYENLCGGSGSCCECSKYATCKISNDQNVTTQTCSCNTNSGSQKYGTACLLSSTESAAVVKQTTSGADESLISSFTVLQVYDLLSNTTYTPTFKQLQAIYSLGLTFASNSVQQNEMKWFLRCVEKMIPKLNSLTSVESSAKQIFQIELMDLIRSLMFKYIDLDTNKKPFFFETLYYSAIIANWKDIINYTNMTLNKKQIQSAKCEYKSNSVLIKYKFILAVSNEMVNSFTNSTFTYNSTVTYCQYMDKSGTIYYRPSSEFHYWHYVPNYDYEVLRNNSDVIGLGCFQIYQTNSVYSLKYDNQECQYKEITTTRTQPYCQCNEPGYTFVQILWSDTKIQALALLASTQATTNTTESYGSIIILLLNLILLIFQ